MLFWVLPQGLSTVGVGDLVRDEVKQGTAVGKQLKVRANLLLAQSCHLIYMYICTAGITLLLLLLQATYANQVVYASVLQQLLFVYSVV